MRLYDREMTDWSVGKHIIILAVLNAGVFLYATTFYYKAFGIVKI